MFRTEDCPAKLASQPQRHNYPKQSFGKPRAPDLPPGFEGNHYADKPNVSNIPRIKWKRPTKVLYNSQLEKPFEAFISDIMCLGQNSSLSMILGWLEMVVIAQKGELKT